MTSEEKDLEKLIGFVKDLQNNLGTFVNRTADDLLDTESTKENKECVNLMKQAFAETVPHFNKMTEYLESNPKEAAKKLASVGLMGAPLDFKLDLVACAKKEIRKAERAYRESVNNSNKDYGQAFTDYQTVINEQSPASGKSDQGDTVSDEENPFKKHKKGIEG